MKALARITALIAAALALGAQAAQLGTAFVPCPESGAPQAHKDALLAAREVYAHHRKILRQAGARPCQPLHEGNGGDERSAARFPRAEQRYRENAAGCGKGRKTRFHRDVGRPGRAAFAGLACRRTDCKAGS